MDFTEFLVIYLLMILAGSLFVTGWYLITRGEYEIMPDNSLKKTGMIFKGWYFFWTKEKPVKKRLFYSGKQLELIYYNEIKPLLETDNVSVWADKIIYKDGELDKNKIYRIEEMLNIKIKDLGRGLDFSHMYGVYIEKPDFVYPEWLRKPLAECATCMASIYGSLFYWIVISLVKVNLFAWAETQIIAKILVWVGFCFSLSVVNTWIAKKV